METVTALPTFGIPDRIRRARLNAGYRTHKDLAHVIGRSSAVVSKWERGKSEPKFHDIVAIARATGADLDFFADGVDSLPPPPQPVAATVKTRRRRAVDQSTRHSPCNLELAA
jgi:transcriptional regulator with XRE-family HTH domain